MRSLEHTHTSGSSCALSSVVMIAKMSKMKTLMYSYKEHRHAQPLCKILLQYFNFFCSLSAALWLEVRKILICHDLFCSPWEILELAVRSFHLSSRLHDEERPRCCLYLRHGTLLAAKHLCRRAAVVVPELEGSVAVCGVWSILLGDIFYAFHCSSLGSPTHSSTLLVIVKDVTVAVMAGTRLLRWGECALAAGVPCVWISGFWRMQGKLPALCMDWTCASTPTLHHCHC